VSSFLTPLRAEKSGSYWVILQPFVYKSDILQTVIVVPEGFSTDFASVPRLPLMFLLAGDEAHEAAVIHDRLYATGEVTRDQADAVFKEAALVTGEPAWRVNLMYAGIRLGGWMAWNEHRSHDQ
jgi:hypothetical protein